MLSVAVALIIGTIELVSILTGKLGIASGPLAWNANLDLNSVGFCIVGLFVVILDSGACDQRLGGIENRWIAGLRPGNSADRHPPRTGVRLTHDL